MGVIYLVVLFGLSGWWRPVVSNGVNPSPFVAWEHYLQECGAELPYQCAGAKKALKQSCVFDSDCISPAICQQSTCQCPKGHVAYQERCQKAPGLDQPCVDGLCAAPLVCTNRDICDCPRVAQRVNGRCEPKCQPDQIFVDGECVRMSTLRGECNSSLQCGMAFAYCNQGRCQCVEGTQAYDGKCVANPVCPDRQEPLKQTNGEYARCRAQPCALTLLPSTPSKVKLDTCPDRYYCVIPSHRDADGFCCPETPYCPMGQPLTGKNCGNPRNEAERCPPETHHCYAASRGTFCCPLPCPSLAGSGAVVVDNGLCYERRQLTEPCTVTAQCPNPAQCLNGTCDCPPGFKVRYSPFGGRTCQRQCAAGTVLVGGECLQLVLPTEQCVHSVQCTAGTKCLAGRCECPCGTIFYDGTCLTMPQCPNFGNGAYDALLNGAGALMECSPTAQVGNAPPPCPDTAFCYPAVVYSGGVCCPSPEPRCPNARSPQCDRDNRPIVCDFSSASPSAVFCSRNYFCYDYAAAVLPSLAGRGGRRGVCCPLETTAVPWTSWTSPVYG